MHSFWADVVGPLRSTLIRIASFVPRFLVAVLLFVVFYGIATLARRLARKALGGVTQIPWAMQVLIGRSIYLLMLLVGALVALSAINVNVGAVIEGLGLAGFALGFALKDILENFLAGILLLFARPFELTDQVTLGNYEGTVVEIQIRTTTLKTYANELVLIPNSQVYTGVVVNHTRLGKRRYAIEFDTSIGADPERVRGEALRAVIGCEGIDAAPSPAVALRRVNGGDDRLSWQVFYWADPTRASEIASASEALHRIKQYLYDAGVPTPTAASEIILRRAPPERDTP